MFDHPDGIVCLVDTMSPMDSLDGKIQSILINAYLIGLIIVADTYNHRLRILDLST